MARRAAHPHPYVVSLLFLLLIASSAGQAGMAELGNRRTFGPGPEAAGSDEADGGASVILSADGRRFTVNTTAMQTVDAILESLEAQINGSGLGLVAVHNANSPEITVTRTGALEVAELSITNTDRGFAYVESSRTRRGAVAVAGFTTPPVGDGAVSIWIDGSIAATTSTAPFADNAAALNLALLAQLQANGCDAILAGDGTFRILANSAGQAILSVAWEDTDGELLDGPSPIILARAEDISGVPAAGPWGLALLTLSFLLALTVLLRRRAATVEG